VTISFSKRTLLYGTLVSQLVCR